MDVCVHTEVIIFQFYIYCSVPHCHVSFNEVLNERVKYVVRQRHQTKHSL